MQKETHKSVITDEKIVLYGQYKKILSVVLVVVAGLALIAFLLSGSIRTTIVNPQYYKDIFKKANTYNDLLEKGIPSVIMESSISDNIVTNVLAKQGMIYVIKNTIPSSWVEKKMETLIDDISLYIANSKSNPKIAVQLNDADEYLIQIVDGLDILEQIIPSCSQAQVTDQGLVSLLNVNVDCSKMSVSLDDIKSEIAKGKTAIQKLEAAEVNLTNEVQKGANFFTGVDQFANRVGGIYWASLAVLILSILIIIWLQFKNIYKILMYVSVPIAGASAIVLLAALISKPSILNALEEKFSLETTPEMQNVIINFLYTAIIDRYTSIITLSSILLGVSLATLVVSMLLHRKKHE